jgi:hypothetical protein
MRFRELENREFEFDASNHFTHLHPKEAAVGRPKVRGKIFHIHAHKGSDEGRPFDSSRWSMGN